MDTLLIRILSMAPLASVLAGFACACLSWLRKDDSVVIKEQYFFFFLTKQMLGYCFVIDILFKTLKKEGHALRNIGNKKYILPTVKSALLLLFKLRYMQKNHGLKQ